MPAVERTHFEIRMACARNGLIRLRAHAERRKGALQICIEHTGRIAVHHRVGPLDLLARAALDLGIERTRMGAIQPGQIDKLDPPATGQRAAAHSVNTPTLAPPSMIVPRSVGRSSRPLPAGR